MPVVLGLVLSAPSLPPSSAQYSQYLQTHFELHTHTHTHTHTVGKGSVVAAVTQVVTYIQNVLETLSSACMRDKVHINQATPTEPHPLVRAPLTLVCDCV